MINFIFAFRGAFGVLDLFSPSALRAMSSHFNAPLRLVVASLAVGVVMHALGVAAGIGYLHQRRVLGWLTGNAYALVGLLGALLANAVVGPAAFGGIIYPIITLVLINSVYRRNLVT